MSKLSLNIRRNRINDENAKYDSRGQLKCIVCGVVVKSEIIWKAHVAKKSHIENLKSLKQRRELLNNPAPLKKRKAPPLNKSQLPPEKVAKAEVKKEVFKPKGILKGVKSNYSSSSESEEEDTKNGEVKVGPAAPEPVEEKVAGPLPKPEAMDEYIDEYVEKIKLEDENDPSAFYLTEEEKKKPAAPPKENTTETLPAGFFDDPVEDAKARKVEFIDKEEAEWNAFRREVDSADIVSNQIIADDSEELAKKNQIEEADVQIRLLKKVVELDAIKKRVFVKAEIKIEDESDDSDEEDLAPVNWRSKSSI